MKELKNKLILAGVFLILIILGILLFFSGRITPNPDYETGNTAGNLNNKGLFCERDGMVYFSNAYDSNVIHCITSVKAFKFRYAEIDSQSCRQGENYPSYLLKAVRKKQCFHNCLVLVCFI